MAVSKYDPELEFAIYDRIDSLRSRIGRQKLHSWICRYIERGQRPCNIHLLSNSPMDFSPDATTRYGQVLFLSEFDEDVVVFIKRLSFFFHNDDEEKIEEILESDLEKFLSRRVFRFEIYHRLIYGYIGLSRLDKANYYFNKEIGRAHV